MSPVAPMDARPRLLPDALRAQRPLLWRAVFYSLLCGALLLGSQWYMFEVYGRVLNSRSESTLGMLTLMVLGVYVIAELLDLTRSRLLQQAGEGLDRAVRVRLFERAFAAALQRNPAGTPQVFNDLRTLRDTLHSPAVTAVLDLPTAAMLLVLLWLLSPWLALLALLGVLMQGLMVWATERRTMPQLNEATRAASAAQAYAHGALRNAQVVESMGMVGGVFARWMQRQRRFLALQAQASDFAGLNAAAAKFVQTMQSSVLLGMACWLLLEGRLWGGGAMLIVASILGGRALAPLAQLVPQWRNVVNARDAWRRLDALLGPAEEPPQAMPLPRPQGVLTVEQVIAAPPGSPVPVLRGVNMVVRPGEMATIIGPSGSGKTSLARVILGIWPATAGKVRLDGVDVFGWNKDELGPHVGYLPQGVELFDGTVAENIARFGRVDMDQVREAARRVGLTEAIEALPDGFDTRIGEDGAVLSGGQRQRLGLARALYGRPRLLVLDEPNASLDEAGEQMLLQLMQQLKSEGCAIVAITHRTSLLPAATTLMMLVEGQTKAFGPRDEVLAALQKAADQARTQGSGVRPAAAMVGGAA